MNYKRIAFRCFFASVVLLSLQQAQCMQREQEQPKEVIDWTLEGQKNAIQARRIIIQALVHTHQTGMGGDFSELFNPLGIEVQDEVRKAARRKAPSEIYARKLANYRAFMTGFINSLRSFDIDAAIENNPELKADKLGAKAGFEGIVSTLETARNQDFKAAQKGSKKKADQDKPKKKFDDDDELPEDDIIY